jgi:hypothetical protein
MNVLHQVRESVESEDLSNIAGITSFEEFPAQATEANVRIILKFYFFRPTLK